MKRSPLPHGYRITQQFSENHPALDIVALYADGTDYIHAPVMANEAGFIYLAWRHDPNDPGLTSTDPLNPKSYKDVNNRGGNFVILQTLDKKAWWYYGHLAGKRVPELEVQTGDRVNEGQVLGYAGASGYVTGEHLHWEGRKGGATWRDGESIHPVKLFGERELEATKVLKEDKKVIEYEIQPGDSLWRLAERFLGDGSRWKEIEVIGYDGLPQHLPVGTKIKIYVGEYKRKSESGEMEEYITKHGDTLWGIAERFLGNGALYGQIKGYYGDPTKLPVGIKLWIPKK